MAYYPAGSPVSMAYSAGPYSPVPITYAERQYADSALTANLSARSLEQSASNHAAMAASQSQAAADEYNRASHLEAQRGDFAASARSRVASPPSPSQSAWRPSAGGAAAAPCERLVQPGQSPTEA